MDLYWCAYLQNMVKTSITVGGVFSLLFKVTLEICSQTLLCVRVAGY